jgi:hypothetical protein
MRGPVGTTPQPDVPACMALRVVFRQHARNGACGMREIEIEFAARTGATITSQRVLRIRATCGACSVTDCPNVGCRWA